MAELAEAEELQRHMSRLLNVVDPPFVEVEEAEEVDVEEAEEVETVEEAGPVDLLEPDSDAVGPVEVEEEEEELLEDPAESQEAPIVEAPEAGANIT